MFHGQTTQQKLFIDNKFLEQFAKIKLTEDITFLWRYYHPIELCWKSEFGGPAGLSNHARLLNHYNHIKYVEFVCVWVIVVMEFLTMFFDLYSWPDQIRYNRIGQKMNGNVKHFLPVVLCCFFGSSNRGDRLVTIGRNEPNRTAPVVCHTCRKIHFIILKRTSTCIPLVRSCYLHFIGR